MSGTALRRAELVKSLTQECVRKNTVKCRSPLRHFKISWTNLKLRELPGNVPGNRSNFQP